MKNGRLVFFSPWGHRESDMTLVNEQQLAGQQRELTNDRWATWESVKATYTWIRIGFRKVTMYVRGKRCVWRKLQKIFIKGNVCLWGVSNRLLRFLENISASKLFYYNMLHVYSYVSLEDCITYWKEKDDSHPKLWTMYLKVFKFWTKGHLT